VNREHGKGARGSGGRARARAHPLRAGSANVQLLRNHGAEICALHTAPGWPLAAGAPPSRPRAKCAPLHAERRKMRPIKVGASLPARSLSRRSAKMSRRSIVSSQQARPPLSGPLMTSCAPRRNTAANGHRSSAPRVRSPIFARELCKHGCGRHQGRHSRANSGAANTFKSELEFEFEFCRVNQNTTT